MTRDEIKAAVLLVLGGIAPEADLSKIEGDVGFRDQLDLDSVDLLNFLIGVHKQLGVEIPEADYAKLSTLDRCIDYLSAVLESSKKTQSGETVSGK